MLYYFDYHGWHTETEIPGRSTDVVPPAPKGKKRPNWLGESWTLLEYVEPVPLATPAAKRKTK